MTCKNCTTFRAYPSVNRSAANCLWCGARLIQAIQRLRIPAPERSQRCRAALDVWVEWGHDEATIRELVNGGPACEPVVGR